MRKLAHLILGFLLVLVFQQMAFASDSLKIGVVSLQRCMDESNEGKRITKILNDKNDSIKKQLEEKRQELIDLKKEIEKQSMILSLDAQEDKRREYDAKGREYQVLYQNLGMEMQKADSEARKAFLKDLQGIVLKIVENEKYDLILDKGIGVLYSSSGLDITDKVIIEYNRLKP